MQMNLSLYFILIGSNYKYLHIDNISNKHNSDFLRLSNLWEECLIIRNSKFHNCFHRLHNQMLQPKFYKKSTYNRILKTFGLLDGFNVTSNKGLKLIFILPENII